MTRVGPAAQSRAAVSCSCYGEWAAERFCCFRSGSSRTITR